MRLTVVIPARNAATTIADQLRAVVAQAAEQAAEVLVVDNGSTDGTGDVARGFPGVHVLVEPRAGLNRARNAGTRAAGGDAILLCDADDIVGPGWLAALAEAALEADYFGGPLDVSTLNCRRTLLRWGHQPRGSDRDCCTDR